MAKISKDITWKFDAEHFESLFEMISLSGILKQISNKSIASLSANLGLIGALNIVKESMYLVRSLVSSGRLPIYPTLNPEVIVGETVTSKDKTVTGTVESQTIRDARSTVPISDPERIGKLLDKVLETIIFLELFEKDYARAVTNTGASRRRAMEHLNTVPEFANAEELISTIRQNELYMLDLATRKKNRSYQRRKAPRKKRFSRNHKF